MEVLTFFTGDFKLVCSKTTDTKKRLTNRLFNYEGHLVRYLSRLSRRIRRYIQDDFWIRRRSEALLMTKTKDVTKNLKSVAF
jgi:hypothetical protein